MATSVYTNNQYYSDIADAIRNKNGTNTQYKPSEMAVAINSLIVSGGSINLQAKTVSPTTSQQIIGYDNGYNGLSQVTVNAIPSQYIIPNGNKSITTNGTGIDVTQYATVSVNVSTGGGTPTLQSKDVVPTESLQVIQPDSGYDGLSQVNVGAIGSTYVGSGVTQRSSSDLTVSGATVTAPAGYYTTVASKSVATMTLPTSVSTTSSGTSKLTITPTTASRYINIPTGYNGTASYYTINGDADLVADNIKSGVQIFGVTGTYTGLDTSDATATAYDIISGKTAYVNGLKITGVIPSFTQYSGTVGYYFSTENSERIWHIEGYIDSNQNGFIYAGQRLATGEYTFNAIPANTIITPTTSVQTIGGANYMMEGAVTVSAMPTGTAGTPTATKGTVSNHSISVTPSVTNTTGYITGSTKTGTTVTVSASELVSGSETKTANGTYDVTNLAELVVNVSGGSSKNSQTAQSTTRATSSTYTELVTLTCAKTGTYHVYWSAFRSSTGGTSGSQLYINDEAYGTAQTGSWSNHIQNIHLTNVQISADDEVAVRVRSRGSNYYGYVGTLTIIEQ